MRDTNQQKQTEVHDAREHFDRCIEEADYFRRMADRMKQRQDRVQVALLLCSALALTCASFTDIPLVVHPVLPAINAIVVILTSLMVYFQWGRHAQEYRETFSRMVVEFDQYIRHRGKYTGLSHDPQ